MIAALCLAASVVYSGILGDVFTQLFDQFSILPTKYNHRTSNIVAITATLLLPMSLLKDLSAFAFTSLLGFAAIMYTVIFVAWRALDGTYTLETGKFVTDGALAELPSFEKASLWNIDLSSLVLISNFGLAYVAHYNGPSFFRELKDTNSRRFAIMVGSSFLLLTILYCITMAAGYSTFGDTCKGNLLLNYHPDDILSTLGRLATGFSILFGFPLIATGAREALVGAGSSWGFPDLDSDKNHFWLVAGILTFVTAISCTVKDVSLVVGLTGAAMGSFICYVCPALIYVRAVALTKGEDSTEYRTARWNLALVPFGLAIAALGVWMTLHHA
jgi:amino acid permease